MNIVEDLCDLIVTSFIESNWLSYFISPNEGLGTTYERFILHRYFESIQQNHSIETVLEVPSFGMTGLSGINSLWWAYNGATITILDDDEDRIHMVKGVWQGLALKANFVYQPYGFGVLPFKDKSFDLGWNFASLRFVADLKKFLVELVRVSTKVIFICVPNQGNIWNFLLRLSREKGKDVPIPSVNPKRTVDIMDQLGWNTIEQGYLDVPPWPDIAMKKEDFLRKIGFKKLAQKLEKRNGGNLSILDYFNDNNRMMESEILRYSFLEQFPTVFKRFWAHHEYFVFTPHT